MSSVTLEWQRVQHWVATGSPWIWLQAAAVAICVLLVTGLLLLIAMRGLGHFWPAPVHEWVVDDPQTGARVLMGQMSRSERVPALRLREAGLSVPDSVETMERHLLKVGNRDLNGRDFAWILERDILERSLPLNAVVMERIKWGVFIGNVVGLKESGELVDSRDLWPDLKTRLQRAVEIRDQIEDIQAGEIGSINYQLERLRLREIAITGNASRQSGLADLLARRAELEARFSQVEALLDDLFIELERDQVLVESADRSLHEYPLSEIMDIYRPNRMSLVQKVGHYFKKLWAFLSDDPREANTEGGVFPAIFGTILMVFIMTLVVAPLGVVAAIYLSEYARQGAMTRFLRIAVNNLAGVPSIVYGVFGLGFFIYVVGGGIDRLFYSEALPQPTFGTGGLIWAALTLALLTLPVVIVSTEEGLARIPRTVREGSLALGATQWETLWRTVLPMASPGIMTGVILAVARAAGEVAPLMLVGVVKLAPALPVDGNFPFVHLERKFMHLGFHIYDVGFQSPNVEAARPLVYATALLLVVITLSLNMVAIRIRNRLRERYRGMDNG